MHTLMAVFLVATAAFAQTAKVVMIDPADVAILKQAYEAKQAADAKWNEARQNVHDLYLTVEAELDEASAILYRDGLVNQGFQSSAVYPKKLVKYRQEIPGWLAGFDFSEDFRFLVPLTPQATPNQGQIQVPCGNLIAPGVGADSQWVWTSPGHWTAIKPF